MRKEERKGTKEGGRQGGRKNLEEIILETENL